jgi:hypothetical protein
MTKECDLIVYEVETIYGFDLLVNRNTGYLHYPEESQYHEDDNDDDQNMDPTAGLRETWKYVSTKKAKQPKDY